MTLRPQRSLANTPPISAMRCCSSAMLPTRAPPTRDHRQGGGRYGAKGQPHVFQLPHHGGAWLLFHRAVRVHLLGCVASQFLAPLAVTFDLVVAAIALDRD